MKLTAEHLEVLVKLAINNKPIKYTEFLPNLNPALDLIDKHYVNKNKEYYELSSKGKEYFNKVIQYASEYFEKIKSN